MTSDDIKSFIAKCDLNDTSIRIHTTSKTLSKCELVEFKESSIIVICDSKATLINLDQIIFIEPDSSNFSF